MLYRLIYIVLQAYLFGLIAYTLLSWIQDRRAEQARRWLGQFYEPVLAPLRAAIKPVRVGAGMLDLSPILLFVGILLAQRLGRDIILGVLQRGPPPRRRGRTR